MIGNMVSIAQLLPMENTILRNTLSEMQQWCSVRLRNCFKGLRNANIALLISTYEIAEVHNVGITISLHIH
jgi:hypothetical protein